MNESLGVASVHGAHDVSAGAAHAKRATASSVEGVHSDPVQHDEGRPRDEGACSSMEHGERIESRNERESGEGAEEERGASNDEKEAVVGSEREGGGLTGAIKKKRPPRKRSKGALSRQQRRDAEGSG